MDQPFRVQVIQSLGDLSKDFPFLLLHLFVGVRFDETQQSVAFAELHLDIQNVYPFLILLLIWCWVILLALIVAIKGKHIFRTLRKALRVLDLVLELGIVRICLAAAFFF